MHPLSTALWPVVDGVSGLAHAETVAAFGEKVQFAGDVEFFALQIEHGGRDRILTIVMGAGEEHGRHVGRHGEAMLELGRLFEFNKTAAVDHDAEIGQLRFCDAITGEVREQVSSRAEAEQADALGVEVPFLGMLAHEGESLGGILDGLFMGCGLVAGGRAIFEQEACDADAIEPFTDLRALMHGREKDVTAARCDDHAGTVRMIGAVEGDRRLVNVGDGVFAGLGAYEVVGGFGMRLHFSWSTFRPEFESQRLGGVEWQRDKEKQKDVFHDCGGAGVF